MDSASEFLQMAATLLLIKSRALLPSEKEQEALEEDKRDIMERLAEYRAFKEAGEHLSELQKSELGVVYKLPEDIPPFEDYKPMFANATVQALSKAYIRALRRLEKRKPDSPPTVQIVSDSFSLRRQTQLIPHSATEIRPSTLFSRRLRPAKKFPSRFSRCLSCCTWAP